MTAWQSLLLGIVQGLTEFLPISSKGHLALASMTLGLENDLTFDVLLHLATLAAIIWFFRRTLSKLTLKNWFLLGMGTIPVGLAGVLVEKHLERWLQMPLFVMLGLIITASLNFYAQWKLKRLNHATALPQSPFASDTKKLAVVSFAQAFAILPGISRSGTTIISGLAAGLSKQAAFEWSFLLAIPAILAASLFQGWQVYSSTEPLPPLVPMVIGMLSAFIVGLLSLKLLRYVMQKDEFWIFGIYCLGLAAVVFFVGVR